MEKVVLLFPGQGSQYSGMGKVFYENHTIVRELFQEASDILGLNLAKLCFEGSMGDLMRTENAQPAILVTSVAMFKVFMQEIAIMPQYAAGHSLGEISALTCAGVISFADSIRLVRKRGILMGQAMLHSEGAMYAISGIGKNTIEQYLHESKTTNGVVISNYNSPEQFVISGYKDATYNAAKELENKGARIVQLKVSAPFHCALMQVAADKFKEELCKYSYNKSTFPVMTNVTASPYTENTNVIENLSSHIVRPVLWQDTMDYLLKQGISTFIEIGPQTVLRNLTRKNISGAKTFAYDNENDAKSMKTIFGISKFKSNEDAKSIICSFVQRCLTESICTKNSNWDEDEYQKGILVPYRRIQQIHSLLEKKEKEAEVEDAKETLELLKLIMNNKKVPCNEQEQRINQIIKSTGAGHLIS